ncbi:HNH endonuclease signature motif containing protein [Streptomyces aurantiacus]|uniref:HNH nuclease domain-containing protein n=1 Tax=Streptomyces aurantiacus JA 4570 TaxID=1286094 RepID=S3ZPQ2_9ACTN|nr:HNH endonuclease signature motif containing protein [Streptomyces aurantiacus]EPH40345.1 hypothetical protein STRAU_6608 [Streptomyces aurantiacus JA 4570]
MPDLWTDRFLARLIGTDSGCWQWTGHIAANGYGQFWLDGRTQYAHRVAYTAVRGLIPAELELDHLCRNRACANPDHLEAVPHRTNVLRGVGFCAHKARQTHCIHGHAFTTANTYRDPANGTRKCRTCRAAARARSRHRRRGVHRAAA